MSNEADLDWLARNVHVWPAGDHQPWCYVYMVAGGAMKASGNFLDAVTSPTMITEDQWLSRRAELQNKPSWGSVGSDINFISQHDDGQWIGHSEKPEEGRECFECDCEIPYYGYGEILGDWRDTLEKRPEEFKSSIEEANRLAQEFKQFTSIEDNQEQEMKQDSGWYERGELPPVGVECEAKKYEKEEWYKVVICGAGKHLGLAVAFYEKQKGSGAFTCSSAEYFRPIRTERDELIRLIKTFRHTLRSDGEVADTILAAGFKLEAK